MANKGLLLPSNRLFNNSNIAAPGGTASLYLSGTLTPANFLDSGGTSLGPTITANGLGQLPDAYGDETVAYRLILKDSNGVQLDGGDIDPFYFGADNAIFTLAPGATVAYRVLLAAISGPTNKQSAILAESGREGTFVFDSSNLSAKVTADTAQAIYVAPTTDTSGASGAWVRKLQGDPLLTYFGAKGDGTTDDSTAINTAQTIATSLGLGTLRFNEGLTFLATATITLGASVTIEGAGATLKSTLDGKAVAFNGSGLKVRGLTIYQAATGADPAPYVEVNGANVVIENCTFTRDATAHIPFYVRSTATGFRFRNNRCTWYGGMNLISDVVDFQITGNSFVNPGASSDDGIAIKATGTGSRRGLIAFNYFENMADFVGIGSEIGSAGVNDSTYSHHVRGIEIIGNTGKNCARMVMIKPGGIDGVDYRDGTVRGITISDNTLIDDSGTALLEGILIQPGRGARVLDVTGKNNKIIGRCVVAGSAAYGLHTYLRNDGVGTANVLIDKIDVGVEIIDPYDGAANGVLVNGVAAPGAPFTNAVALEKQTSGVGTATNVMIDAIANGTRLDGIRIASGYDNGVTVRRFLGTNINTGLSSSNGGIHYFSAISVGDEISITMAPGNSGTAFKQDTGGSLTPLYPQQVPAYSMVGNTSNAAATGAAVTGVPRVLSQSGVQVPHTGDTSVFTLATINLPANTMGANGRLEIEADFTYPNSANNKTFAIKLGSTTLWTATVAASAHVGVRCEVTNRNSAASQRWQAIHRVNTGSIGDSSSTSAVGTASTQTITITGQLASGTETLNLESYCVKVIPGA